MTITRHISLDDIHVQKMKPYLEKYGGNFGIALKEIISKTGKHSSGARSSILDISLFNWMLSEIEDRLMPDEILDEMIQPDLIHSMEGVKRYLESRFIELNWNIDITLKCDSDTLPNDILIELRGAPQKIRFAASLLSQYLVKNSQLYSPLEIRHIVHFNEYIKIELSRSNKKDAQKSLAGFFGGIDEVIRAIKSKPEFWRSVIHGHILSDYNMVTVHRNYFEDILCGKIPVGETTIENLAKRPLKEIPLKEMLSLVKDVYETSRMVDAVNIDNDSIILIHSYRNKEAIEKLKKSLLLLLETNGHLFDANSTTNMIILRHRPDVGIKINEIVDNLKMSNSSMDQELMMFLLFLKGLKEIPDIPLSLVILGRRIGRSLMKEYEKENDIAAWNLESFQKAIETIDSRLHRESEWKTDGKNRLYTVKKCSIASDGVTFDNYVCHTVRETFKGALNYAFGNKAEFEINKLLTHGDNFCEVVIRIY